MVTSAANQAKKTNALRLALDEFCRHTGWPVGHAYLLADGELVTRGRHLDDPEQFEAFSARPRPTSFPESGLARSGAGGVGNQRGSLT